MADNDANQVDPAPFDYLMTPEAPVAFTVESLLNPNGDIYYGYVTNVKGKRFRELPNDYMLDMDVGEPERRDDGSWGYAFKRKRIKKADIIAASLDYGPINEADFGADYQFYKNPTAVQKEYRKAVGMNPSDDESGDGAVKGKSIMGNEKPFTGIVLGFLAVAILVSFGAYVWALVA